MKLRNLLLPTEHNDYTPHALQKIAIVPLFLLILLSFAASNLQSFFWKSSDWLVGAVLPAVIVDLTNDERIGLQERPLQRNASLDRAAQLKAEDMAKNHYFAHYSPSGVTPWYWFEQVSYTYVHAGENLAIHFSDSEDVIKAWMKSPLHKENIVNANYTEIGVGTAKGTFDGYETVFVVQLFGTPAAPLQPQRPLPVAKLASAALAINDTTVLKEESTATSSLPAEPGVVEGESTENAELMKSEPEVLSVSEAEIQTGPELLTETVAVTDNDAAYRSSFISTSTNLFPARLEDMSGTTASKAPIIGSLATKPNTLLQGLYLIVGLILATILLMSIVLGAKHHRPMQVAYGIGLMLLMSGLFYVHVLITAKVVIASAPTAVNIERSL